MIATVVPQVAAVLRGVPPWEGGLISCAVYHVVQFIVFQLRVVREENCAALGIEMGDD